MNLDVRAASACADLLERAQGRGVPDPVALVAQRRRSPKALAMAAAAAVVVLVVGFLVLRPDGSKPAPPITPMAPPAGVEGASYEPAGLGVSMLVPSDWAPNASTGFDHSVRAPDGDAYVASSRIAVLDDADATTVARDRATNLAAFDTVIESSDRATIDGHDAVVSHETLPRGPRVPDPIAVTEYLIDLDDGTYALVVVGERQPADKLDVRAWIGSTLSVSPTPAFETSTVHPRGTVRPPAAVDGRTIAPKDLDVTMQVPATWVELSPPPSRFQFGIAPPSPGYQPFVLASRVVQADGSLGERLADLDRFGAAVDDQTETSIDGHAATVLRYRIPNGRGSHIATVDVEYLIDLGNGDVAIVTFGVGLNPDTAQLVEWMRSTIHVKV